MNLGLGSCGEFERLWGCCALLLVCAWGVPLGGCPGCGGLLLWAAGGLVGLLCSCFEAPCGDGGLLGPLTCMGGGLTRTKLADGGDRGEGKACHTALCS